MSTLALYKDGIINYIIALYQIIYLTSEIWYMVFAFSLLSTLLGRFEDVILFFDFLTLVDSVLLLFWCWSMLLEIYCRQTMHPPQFFSTGGILSPVLYKFVEPSSGNSNVAIVTVRLQKSYATVCCNFVRIKGRVKCIIYPCDIYPCGL